MAVFCHGELPDYLDCMYAAASRACSESSSRISMSHEYGPFGLNIQIADDTLSKQNLSELTERRAMQECDFFREVPLGCGANLMKNVLVDWNDEQAHAILVNCRRAVPDGGALVVVEFGVAEDNLPSRGKFVGLAMLVLTGGKVPSARECSDLFSRAGFRLNQVIPVQGGLSVFEARPA